MVVIAIPISRKKSQFKFQTKQEKIFFAPFVFVRNIRLLRPSKLNDFALLTVVEFVKKAVSRSITSTLHLVIYVWD